jgi:hypothetical protein
LLHYKNSAVVPQGNSWIFKQSSKMRISNELLSDLSHWLLYNPVNPDNDVHFWSKRDNASIWGSKFHIATDCPKRNYVKHWRNHIVWTVSLWWKHYKPARLSQTPDMISVTNCLFCDWKLPTNIGDLKENKFHWPRIQSQ